MHIYKEWIVDKKKCVTLIEMAKMFTCFASLFT